MSLQNIVEHIILFILFTIENKKKRGRRRRRRELFIFRSAATLKKFVFADLNANSNTKRQKKTQQEVSVVGREIHHSAIIYFMAFHCRMTME